MHIDSKHETMKGLAFPIADDAAHKIIDFLQDKITYVQLVGSSDIIIYVGFTSMISSLLNFVERGLQQFIVVY